MSQMSQIVPSFESPYAKNQKRKTIKKSRTLFQNRARFATFAPLSIILRNHKNQSINMILYTIKGIIFNTRPQYSVVWCHAQSFYIQPDMVYYVLYY